MERTSSIERIFSLEVTFSLEAVFSLEAASSIFPAGGRGSLLPSPVPAHMTTPSLSRYSRSFALVRNRDVFTVFSFMP